MLSQNPETSELSNAQDLVGIDASIGIDVD